MRVILLTLVLSSGIIWLLRHFLNFPERGAALPYIILFGGFFIWTAFFAQFVLPVRTFADRQKIFSRLLTYLSGFHGPAIFVENGQERAHEGENERRGPGVVWLDTASGAVLRTQTKFTRAIGPGVHFTTRFEYIAGTVDLHTQIQSVGPRRAENPFTDIENPDKSQEEREAIRSRREETSALTRDGIEIVPSVTVLFKVEGKPAKGSAPGSRFGYDKEAVFKAIAGESIDPSALADTERRKVPWNRLPALLAVDLWREYLRKFTFNSLFEEREVTYLVEISSPPQPCPPEATRRIIPPRNTVEKIERSLRLSLEKLLKFCMGAQYQPLLPPEECPGPRDIIQRTRTETGLQTIARMVKERLQNEKVARMNEVGEYTGEMVPSPEYQLLQKRGIRVTTVAIRNLHFHPSIDEQLVQSWTSTWLANAKAESDLINDLHKQEEVAGKRDALKIHAEKICRPLAAKLSQGQKLEARDTLKILLANTRTEIHQDNRLNRRLSIESDEITEILQWIESIKW